MLPNNKLSLSCSFAEGTLNLIWTESWLSWLTSPAYLSCCLSWGIHGKHNNSCSCTLDKYLLRRIKFRCVCSLGAMTAKNRLMCHVTNFMNNFISKLPEERNRQNELFWKESAPNHDLFTKDKDLYVCMLCKMITSLPILDAADFIILLY